MVRKQENTHLVKQPKKNDILIKKNENKNMILIKNINVIKIDLYFIFDVTCNDHDCVWVKKSQRDF